MGRIMAVDYGLKRVGIAVTDPLKIISSPLETVDAAKIFPWLEHYFSREQVEKLVVGMPVKLDQSDTHATEPVRKFIAALRNKFPAIAVEEVDERFTSSLAKNAILQSGMGKMKRRDKSLVDKVSASLILQTYLGN